MVFTFIYNTHIMLLIIIYGIYKHNGFSNLLLFQRFFKSFFSNGFSSPTFDTMLYSKITVFCFFFSLLQ